MGIAKNQLSATDRAVQAIEASARQTAFRVRKNVARDYRREPWRLDRLRPGLSSEAPRDMIAAIRSTAAAWRAAERAAHLRRNGGPLGDLSGRLSVGGAMIYARWLRRYADRLTEAA